MRACVLVRLTHAFSFPATPTPSDPTRGVARAIPGPCCFCGVPKQVYVLPVEGDCVLSSPPKLLVCMDFATSWTRREEEVTPTAYKYALMSAGLCFAPGYLPVCAEHTWSDSCSSDHLRPLRLCAEKILARFGCVRKMQMCEDATGEARLAVARMSREPRD